MQVSTQNKLDYAFKALWAYICVYQEGDGNHSPRLDVSFSHVINSLGLIKQFLQ